MNCALSNVTISLLLDRVSNPDASKGSGVERSMSLTRTRAGRNCLPTLHVAAMSSTSTLEYSYGGRILLISTKDTDVGSGRTMTLLMASMYLRYYAKAIDTRPLNGFAVGS